MKQVERFALFDQLVKASGVELQPGDQIFALENEKLEEVYDVLGTNHDQFLGFPELNHVIENHIADVIHTNTIQMVSGATFAYVPNKFVDGIQLFKAYNINGMVYIPFDGILLTAMDYDDIREYLKSLNVKTPPKVARTAKDVHGQKALAKPGVVAPPPATKKPSPASGTATAQKPKTPPSPKTRKPAQPRVPFEEAMPVPAHIQAIKDLPRMGPSTISNAGWGEIEPKRGAERAALKAKCGDPCFLRPKDNAFPICAKLSVTGGECQVSCTGLAAAKNRARFLPEEFSEKIIPDLQAHHGCKGVKSGGVVQRRKVAAVGEKGGGAGEAGAEGERKEQKAKQGNPWINFGKIRRAELKKERPDLAASEITKLLSAEWAKKSLAEKDSYR